MKSKFFGQKEEIRLKCLRMDNFENKKVLIMGLGLHGGGVAGANWFFKQKTPVKITDL